MGDVYLCDEKALGRKVAVKIMHSLDAGDPDAAGRFLLEGKALAKLSHPNIVSVFGLGEDRGYLYIAMEYVPGRSLFQLTRERKLNLREMISIFADIAAGLDHAHSLGIVHRDIKPANILVDHNGRAKLIDFGIAKSMGGSLVGAEGVKTKTGAVIGTLNYIAPELFRGIEPSPSSDIYALGLIFFEMLTGRTPFKGDSQFATMEKIRSGDLEVPENLRMLLPEAFWTVLHAMVDHEPLKRPRTCSEGAAQIKAISLPNLPAYFNADLVTVTIDNIKDLQAHLESLAVDPAEWQFVLSLAVRIHGQKPNESGGSNSDDGESTKLIESTGIVIPVATLDEALDSYKKDLETIYTMRRAESLTNLTVPEGVAEFLPHTGGVDVQPVLKGQRPSEAGRSALDPSASVVGRAPEQLNSPQAVKGSSAGTWVAAVGAVALVAGFYVWKTKENAKLLQEQARMISEVKSQSVRRKIGPLVQAPNLAQTATGQVASNSSFAMVVEPTQDAWAPVTMPKWQVGHRQLWKWRERPEQGQERAFLQKRTLVEIANGLLEFQIEESALPAAGSRSPAAPPKFNPAGKEWIVPGFFALPRKTLQSRVFGTIGGTITGEPERTFPLRKGKELQFELAYQITEQVSFSPIAPLGGYSPIKYKSTCSVKDKIPLVVGTLGQQSVVKIDCSTQSDTQEVKDTLYFSDSRGVPLRHDRRVLLTVGGKIKETSLIGEIVSHDPVLSSDEKTEADGAARSPTATER